MTQITRRSSPSENLARSGWRSQVSSGDGPLVKVSMSSTVAFVGSSHVRRFLRLSGSICTGDPNNSIIELLQQSPIVLVEGRTGRADLVRESQGDELDPVVGVNEVPAVNQIELHPYLSQKENEAANTARGFVAQAWSPIGGITFHPTERWLGNEPAD